MENVFVISFLVTALFCLAKFVEMKFLENELKPLKFLMRDAVIVFVCSVLATFVFFNMDVSLTDFLNVMTETKTAPVGGAAEIFTEAPGF